MLKVHPTHPQQRLISKATAIIDQGGVVAYPTDSAYALGCALDNREGIERIRKIRELDKNHNFTLVCRDLSELSSYARVDNQIFRLLKAHTPGPYTFIMQATREVPKRLQHPKKKTIGLRIPEHPVTMALLESLEKPMLSVSFIMPGDSLPVSDLDDLDNRIISQLDEVIDSGACGIEATTVIDLTAEVPELIRQGKGESELFR